MHFRVRRRHVKQATYLSVQLRESVPYLRDAGWRETAALLTVAADEIEQLRARVMDLEGRPPQPQPTVGGGYPTSSTHSDEVRFVCKGSAMRQ